MIFHTISETKCLVIFPERQSYVLIDFIPAVLTLPKHLCKNSGSQSSEEFCLGPRRPTFQYYVCNVFLRVSSWTLPFHPLSSFTLAKKRGVTDRHMKTVTKGLAGVVY